MGNLAADIRYALRMMRTNPAFTAVAITVLALGIAANTAIFTVIDSVLLQPLPYPEPDRIMQLGRLYPDNNYGFSNSIPKYMVWRQNQVFGSIALFGQGGPGMNLERRRPARTGQIPPCFQRIFQGIWRSAADRPDLHGVRRHSRRTECCGSQLFALAEPPGRKPGDHRQCRRAQRRAVHRIGVLARGFQPDPPADVFLPIQADPNSVNQGHYLRAAARLKPGVTVEVARAQMKAAGERFRSMYPKFMDKNESVAVVPMREATVGDVKSRHC